MADIVDEYKVDCGVLVNYRIGFKIRSGGLERIWTKYERTISLIIAEKDSKRDDCSDSGE
jgi:hypothetical protein